MTVLDDGKGLFSSTQRLDFCVDLTSPKQLGSRLSDNWYFHRHFTYFKSVQHVVHAGFASTDNACQPGIFCVSYRDNAISFVDGLVEATGRSSGMVVIVWSVITWLRKRANSFEGSTSSSTRYWMITVVKTGRVRTNVEFCLEYRYTSIHTRPCRTTSA